MQYLEYAQGVGVLDEGMNWVKTTLQARLKNNKLKSPSVTEVEHILDYLASDKAPKKMKRMSYKQANEKAKAWTKTLQKKGKHIIEQPADVEVIHDFGDGSRIIKLVGAAAFEREGYLMRHCVGSYKDKNVLIYSYRDAKNEPHATFQVDSSNNQFTQIKGKGNGPIHPRYINPIIQFLQSIGIQVRDSEMKNLGYIKPSKEDEKIINDMFNQEVEFHSLLGKRYLYCG